MSPGGTPSEIVAGVVDTLRQSRTLLLDPAPHNIDRCRVAILQCVHKISALMLADRSQWDKHELTEQALQIRVELTAIAQLLDSAAAYRRGMLSALSATDRPRTADFDPAAPQTVRGVHVLG